MGFDIFRSQIFQVKFRSGQWRTMNCKKSMQGLWFKSHGQLGYIFYIDIRVTSPLWKKLSHRRKRHIYLLSFLIHDIVSWFKSNSCWNTSAGSHKAFRVLYAMGAGCRYEPNPSRTLPFLRPISPYKLTGIRFEPSEPTTDTHLAD